VRCGASCSLLAEGLSDRQAADAVRARIDWKYLLCLELTDPGFHYSVLSEFRTRLFESEWEQKVFDKLLMCFREAGYLKKRGQLRTDSTVVLGAVRELNRLELVGETLRHALDSLALVAPGWIVIVAGFRTIVCQPARSSMTRMQIRLEPTDWPF